MRLQKMRPRLAQPGLAPQASDLPTMQKLQVGHSQRKIGMHPTTIEEARKHRYGAWAGWPKGSPFDPANCIEEVCGSGRGATFHQCGRRPQKDSPFCVAHDPEKKAKRDAERQATYDEKWAAIRKREELESCGAQGYELAKLVRDTFMIGDHEAEPVLELARKIIAKVEKK